jgi:hypothetical protein
MENTQPSYNDLVNTTLGGMVRGEIAHRVSAMLVDNTATGAKRVVEELAAAIYDPVGGFNRLVHGEMFHTFENPPDRLPHRFLFQADLGYRHVADSGVKEPNRGLLSLRLTYGDPFERVTIPFQFFDAAVDVSGPGGNAVSLLTERGMLAGWPLTDAGGSSRQAIGVFMHFDYVNNASQVVGAQRFSLGLVSVYTLGGRWELATDIAAVVFPLEGVQTTNFDLPEATRNYDYAPGAGGRAALTLRHAGYDLLSAAYGVTRDWTVSGASQGNTLQFAHGEARIPLGGRIGLGGGYGWYSRATRYADFPTDRKTQVEWRAFLSIKLGEISEQGTAPAKAPTP